MPLSIIVSVLQPFFVVDLARTRDAFRKSLRSVQRSCDFYITALGAGDAGKLMAPSNLVTVRK